MCNLLKQFCQHSFMKFVWQTAELYALHVGQQLSLVCSGCLLAPPSACQRNMLTYIVIIYEGEWTVRLWSLNTLDVCTCNVRQYYS